MLDADITVGQTSETRAYGRDLTPTAIIRLEFFVGKHGPFVEKFPKETYSAEVRDERLNAFAREVRT